MRRLLLTQSQVSVAVSLGVVIIFTSLLFISGLVLQQQTVKGLQNELKPRIPKPPPGPAGQNYGAQEDEIDKRLQRSRIFTNRDGRIAYADFHQDVHASDVDINWRRLAHIQLVQDHHDVCSAVMVLADLHRMKSPARRMLLFPKAWADEKQAEKGDVSNPYLDSTRRLMRKAARRYNVELRPINPISPPDASLVRSHEQYSLASVLALHHEFDRVLTIETPGLLLDAEPLDTILAFTERTPLTMLYDTHDHDGVHAEDLLLLEPSSSTFSKISSRIMQDQDYSTNSSSFSALFSDPLLLASSSESSALIRAISALRDVDAQIDFNQTAFVSDVAYIRFWDPMLPGPEYDVPWSTKLAARPPNKRADWTWTTLYGQFAQRRMDICGLDLESWRA